MQEARTFDPAPAENRRGESRRRVLLAGKIVQGAGAFSSDCGIRDLTEDGARIRLPAPVPVGEDFYLLEMRNGRAYHAEVRWRSDSEIGVSFRRPDPVEDPASPQRRMLQRLWVDAAAR
jgi:hypothetical protein